MLHPPGFYFVKKPKRFVILSFDKSSERNLSCFFDIIKPRRMEHLQSEEPFSSDPYFSLRVVSSTICTKINVQIRAGQHLKEFGQASLSEVHRGYMPPWLKTNKTFLGLNLLCMYLEDLPYILCSLGLYCNFDLNKTC